MLNIRIARSQREELNIFGSTKTFDSVEGGLNRLAQWQSLANYVAKTVNVLLNASVCEVIREDREEFVRVEFIYSRAPEYVTHCAVLFRDTLDVIRLAEYPAYWLKHHIYLALEALPRIEVRDLLERIGPQQFRLYGLSSHVYTVLSESGANGSHDYPTLLTDKVTVAVSPEAAQELEDGHIYIRKLRTTNVHENGWDTYDIPHVRTSFSGRKGKVRISYLDIHDNPMFWVGGSCLLTPGVGANLHYTDYVCRASAGVVSYAI